MCSSCMKNEIETQKHILFCDSLLGRALQWGPEEASLCLKITQRKLQQ